MFCTPWGKYHPSLSISDCIFVMTVSGTSQILPLGLKMPCLCCNCEYLWIFAEKQDEWTDWISTAEFAYINLLHSATGFTPFWLNKGQHPVGHPMEIKPLDEVPAADNFTLRIQTSCNITCQALKKAKLAMK